MIPAPSDKKRSLSDIDQQILSLLLEDGRMSFVEIGRRVSLSAPAVKRRMERLERDGTIRGYTAVVDQAELGWKTEAFLDVYAEGDTSLEALRHSLAQHPEVVAAYTVAGDAEALVHVRAADMPHLEQVIERIHTQPNVVRTRTQIVLTKLAERR